MSVLLFVVATHKNVAFAMVSTFSMRLFQALHVMAGATFQNTAGTQALHEMRVLHCGISLFQLEN